MNSNRSLSIQYLHEATTAINLGFATAAFLLLGPYPSSELFDMDRMLSRRLGLIPDFRIPKDDFTYGYFAFFIPAFLIAVCFWVVLRLSARSALTLAFLRSGAGILDLVAAPIWALCFRYFENIRYGWLPFGEIQLYELVLILVFGIAYLFIRYAIPESTVIIIFALHFGFWFWQFGPNVYFSGYGGPLAPIAGLCASITWIYYLRRLRSSHISY